MFLNNGCKETFFTHAETYCSCAVESEQTEHVVQYTSMKKWLSCHFRVQVFKDSPNGSYMLKS
jgi:hypothetical protein